MVVRYKHLRESCTTESFVESLQMTRITSASTTATIAARAPSIRPRRLRRLRDGGVLRSVIGCAFRARGPRVGAAFAQQEAGQVAQFLVGDGGADAAAPRLALVDEARLREDLHVMGQGRAGDTAAGAERSDREPLRPRPDQGPEHGEPLLGTEGREGRGRPGEVEIGVGGGVSRFHGSRNIEIFADRKAIFR